MVGGFCGKYYFLSAGRTLLFIPSILTPSVSLSTPSIYRFVFGGVSMSEAGLPSSSIILSSLMYLLFGMAAIYTPFFYGREYLTGVLVILLT